MKIKTRTEPQPQLERYDFMKDEMVPVTPEELLEENNVLHRKVIDLLDEKNKQEALP